MHGNVSEWCADAWHENYEGAPNDGSAWNVGGNRDLSPLRGGAWFRPPDSCRSSNRFNIILDGRDSSNSNIGFRVMCVAPRTL